MKSEVSFEDWMKVKLIIGEVVEIGEGKIKINIGEKILETKRDLNVEKRDKIVAGLNGDRLIILLVKGSAISPEKDVENGSRVG